MRRSSCEYTSCYCEENVYLLCKQLCQPPLSQSVEKAWAIWISNENKTVAVWRQGGGGRAYDEEGLAVWDYHVICAVKYQDRSPVIYDLDTTLPFPSPLQAYIRRAFRPQASIRSSFRPRFRVVEARQYLENFSSDRSHMLKAGGGGEFVAKPPSYPCILRASGENNVMKFADMCDLTMPGVVVDLPSLVSALR
ncbi:hypothetical protein GUITHDRAFT_69371 [Guillardia theta CCMP2712]|uniref:Protein N-terminal glutamine amidohydrolase n=1 Tax=Guillardia theta (strain CCMP2712) TaxID=905079 RepID=L1JGR8_GUITC|nr:hypothetical protein GUITHDRAFT_69371 [Guillardia theta CCMP2712]EKX47527.1 hypothetical protein GUITHDRAFT_69371 [Guillardia theta CCMP2712]|eukprot:XP_005834507.1 hypothetical protein GUITHDRAFT_69371 [Guillardia theta CCMP2712]